MLRKIITAFFLRGLGAVSLFLLYLSISQSLDITQAGLFFLVFSILNLFMPLITVGTSVISLKQIGLQSAIGKWGRVVGVSNASIKITFVSGLIASIVIYVLSPIISMSIWNKPEAEPLINTISLALITAGGAWLVAHHLQAVQRLTASIFTLSINLPLSLALTTLLLGLETAQQVISCLVILSVMNFLFAFYLWRTKFSTIKVEKSPIKPMLISSFPVWVAAIMGMLTLWGGQFIAGVWASSEDIARLAVAHRTSLLVSFILIAVNMVTAPRFSSLYHQKRYKEFKTLAIKTAQLMIGVAMPLVIIIFTFPKFIMSLFGEDYESGSHLLIILALGQLVNVITGSVGYMLNMTGHEKDMRNVILISAPVAIFLALTLTPLYGVTGAAIATSIGISIQNLGAVWMVKKRLGFNALAIWQKV